MMKNPLRKQDPILYWTDWLLDAIAMVTQDRRFLRDTEEYDELVGEAILANGKKAIENAINDILEHRR